MSDTALQTVDIDLLTRNSYQPRQHFDKEKLASLATSIREHGFIQPIVARKKERCYEIISGERRWRAAQLNGNQTVPVLIKEATDEEAALAAIAENIDREALTPIELATAYQNIVEEFGITHAEIGEIFGVNAKTVTHTIRLLSLPTKIQEKINLGTLSMGHGKVLLSAPQAHQQKLAEKTIRHSWSVRRLESESKKLLSPTCNQEKKQQSKDPEITRLEDIMGEQLGTNVKIDYHSNKKNGSIVLSFSTLDQLEGILDRLSIDVD